MAVNQVISPIPQAGKRGVDARDAFVTKQEAFQDALTSTAVAQLNTAFSQINTTEANINTKEASATASAEIATEEANKATQSALDANAVANNKGAWSNLTGSLSIPASVNHNDAVWILNTNLSDVTLSEPTVGNTDWTKVGDGLNHTTKTSNYTASANDYIKLNASAGTFQITLDNTLAEDSDVYMLGLDIETNNVTVVDSLGNNIITTQGNTTSFMMNKNNIEVKFKKSGNDWRVL